MVKVSLDLTKVKRQLRELRISLNKTAEETVAEIAQSAAKQLAIKIEPYGITAGAKKIAEGAVLKDVMKAYHGTGQTYKAIRQINPKLAYAYSAAIRNGNLKKAEVIARKAIAGLEVQQTDSGQYLEGKRSSKGRVPNGTAPMNIVADSALDHIRANKILTAGNSKAGFLQAGAAIGSKIRIQSWLRKKHRLGSAKKSFMAFVKSVTIINHVKYVSNLLTGSKVNSAIAYAYRNQRTRMNKQLDAMARKFSQS